MGEPVLDKKALMRDKRAQGMAAMGLVSREGDRFRVTQPTLRGRRASYEVWRDEAGVIRCTCAEFEESVGDDPKFRCEHILAVKHALLNKNVGGPPDGPAPAPAPEPAADETPREPEATAPAAAPLPWQAPPLNGWAIVGMNHYHQGGVRHIFVSMARNRRCITAEGPDADAAKVFEELRRQAEGEDVEAESK